MNRVDEAVIYAMQLHKNQYRKGENHQPYVFHLLEVMNIASTVTQDEDVLIAAMLHDCIEDVGVSLNELEQKFGEKVASYVWMETEDKRGNINKSETWQIRKEESLNDLRNCTDKNARLIWLCDKLSNLRAMAQNKYEMGDQLWDMFNQKDKEKHYWYYSSIAEILSDLSEYGIYGEYLYLLKGVFGDGIEKHK